MIPSLILSPLFHAYFFERNEKEFNCPKRLNCNSLIKLETVKVNGKSIYYVKKGEGRPIILIHGYGAGIWVWEKQIDPLSRFYQVIALDLIGHGFSDRPRIDYTPETYIYFFKDFMEVLGIERATLIGNSMGGGLAWAMAISFPKKVDRLILINSIPPDVLSWLKGKSFRKLIYVKNIPFLIYLAIATRNKNSIKRVLMDCVLNDKLITQDVLNRQYEISMIKGTTWVLYSTFKNAKRALDFKEKLQMIYQPTLIIWGEKDEILPVSVGEYLHRTLPRSRFHLVPNSGHIPMWESPEDVNEVLIKFLEENF